MNCARMIALKNQAAALGFNYRLFVSKIKTRRVIGCKLSMGEDFFCVDKANSR